MRKIRVLARKYYRNFNRKHHRFTEWLWDKVKISYWSVWPTFLNELFGGHNYNWHTFSIIDIEIDWEAYTNEITFTFELLGFGIRYQHYYRPFAESKAGKIVKKRMYEVEELIKEPIDLGKTKDGKYDIKIHPDALKELEDYER